MWPFWKGSQGRKGFLWLPVPAGVGVAGWLAGGVLEGGFSTPAPKFRWDGHLPGVGGMNFRAERRTELLQRVKLMTGGLENDQAHSLFSSFILF